MQMTFDQYIANPMGIKNSVYSNRHMYKDLYTDKLDKILVRETGKVKYTLLKSKDKYYVYMKIPSEVIPKFYYDVVIEFYTDNPTLQYAKTLTDYDVKFYSNDPSFVFTFAHAMITNELFITDLLPVMSKEAIKKVAVERNKNNEIGYVKSIYFTYLLMRRYGLFNKIIFNSEGITYNKKDLISQIMPADEKIAARQNAQKELDQEKKIKKQKAKHDTNNTINRNVSNTGINNHINKVSFTNKVGKVGNNIKKSNKVKFSKKIK